MGTFWGVSIIRIIVYWALYWGPLILRNYHFGFSRKSGEGVLEDCRVWFGKL